MSLPGWGAPLFLLAGAGLVPWIWFLALTLPHREVATHYRVAWVGFDIAMLSILVALAWLAHRRSTWTELVAPCAATLLVVDAWFDVVSSPTSTARLIALGTAVIFELPLAGLCLWLARNAEHVRRRGVRKLWHSAAELDYRLNHRRRGPSGP